VIDRLNRSFAIFTAISCPLNNLKNVFLHLVITTSGAGNVSVKSEQKIYTGKFN
jgi:hypothetical protein